MLCGTNKYKDKERRGGFPCRKNGGKMGFEVVLIGKVY